MNNKAYQRVPSKFIRTLLLLLPLLLLITCAQPQRDETARSGQMAVAVDRSLLDIAGTQSEMFIRYYPDARITLTPSPTGKTLKHLLLHNTRAALISGEPEASEDSLFATLKQPFRREPVARDAIVCIVNSLNSATMLTLPELEALYSGQESHGMTPFLTADDYRLKSTFAAGIGKKAKDLRAWSCNSETELISRVSTDPKAVGLLFRSSLDQLVTARKGEKGIKIIPLAKESAGGQPYQPTQQNIFEGLYPLVTTVYYVYYSGDALAAGFGSWLSSLSGQKLFEKSPLAPYRAAARTIILK